MAIFANNFKASTSPKGDKLYITDTSDYLTNDEGYIETDFTKTLLIKDINDVVLYSGPFSSNPFILNVTDMWTTVKMDSQLNIAPNTLYTVTKNVPLYGQANYKLVQLIDKVNSDCGCGCSSSDCQDTINTLMNVVTAAKYFCRTDDGDNFNKQINISNNIIKSSCC